MRYIYVSYTAAVVPTTVVDVVYVKTRARLVRYSRYAKEKKDYFRVPPNKKA
ncbi:hypothetical protein LTR49_009292 [Elasticomyces elasticus]|nr:hypothetical protein LTR49_009292 [Elasticomyces elasticus]